jgi:hypothetical protein
MPGSRFHTKKNRKLVRVAVSERGSGWLFPHLLTQRYFFGSVCRVGRAASVAAIFAPRAPGLFLFETSSYDRKNGRSNDRQDNNIDRIHRFTPAGCVSAGRERSFIGRKINRRSTPNTTRAKAVTAVKPPPKRKVLLS